MDHKKRYDKSEYYSENAAKQRKQDGFGKELGDDVLSFCSERTTDAYLSHSFGDGGEHYVHNSDTANQQRNAGDGAENYAENPFVPGVLP